MAQLKRLRDFLSDGRPHDTPSIMREVYGDEHLGIARVGARIHDLRHKHGLTIRAWRDETRRTVTWYQLIPPPTTTVFTARAPPAASMQCALFAPPRGHPM